MLILNSDILVGMSISRGVLPEALIDLCALCVERATPIVLPRTTLLEFERHHAQIVENRKADLRRAVQLFKDYSIAHDEVDPEMVIQPPNLERLLEDTGVSVEVVDPNLDDFQRAHHRACMHLPPSTGGKSDEMRDQIIWAIALRVATSSGGAVLLARDALFHDPNGDAEAGAAGLTRIRDIAEAVHHLRGLRPRSEELAARLVVAIRDDLIARGIPLGDQPEHYQISRLVYTADQDGSLSSVEFHLAPKQDGTTQFDADIKLELNKGTVTQVAIANFRSEMVVVEGGSVVFDTSRPANLELDGEVVDHSNSDSVGGERELQD